MIVIRPTATRSFADNLGEIWSSRELILAFAKREISVRYKQAAIGIVWVALQPLVTTGVFTFIFGHLAKISTGAVPYPVFVLSGLLLWQYFNRVLTEGCGSLVANVGLITKVYFPRLIVPMIVTLVAAVDVAVITTALLVLMLINGMAIPPTIIFLPVFVMMAGLMGYAAALWVAPLNAIYRDIGLALPLVMQVVMYLSPVIYPTSLVPGWMQWFYEINPVATLLRGARWSLLGEAPPSLTGLLVYAAVTLFLLAVGFRIFRATEGTLVDRI